MDEAERVVEIFERLKKAIKNPKTELTYVNDYTFCVAVILSAQSTDKAVNKVTTSLFKIASTPEEMLKLGEEQLKGFIKTIGLYNNKAKNIIAFSEVLVSTFDAKIPRDRAVLETLPGIGRKSANVISNNLFDEPYIAVDTHVLRLSKRLGLSWSQSPKEVERDLTRVVPRQFHKDVSNLLVLHGRYVCQAKHPLCSSCILRDLCLFFKELQKA